MLSTVCFYSYIRHLVTILLVSLFSLLLINVIVDVLNVKIDLNKCKTIDLYVKQLSFRYRNAVTNRLLVIVGNQASTWPVLYLSFKIMYARI